MLVRGRDFGDSDRRQHIVRMEYELSIGVPHDEIDWTTLRVWRPRPPRPMTTSVLVNLGK
jgi:hypothetical protein